MDLTLTDFEQYIHYKGDLLDGYQIVLKFPNGYGASLIRHQFSYGGEDGKFEIAVIKFKGDDCDITYDTPVADDVLGHLSPEECIQIFNDILVLPSIVKQIGCNDEE